MAESFSRRFRQGFANSLPFYIVVLPFGLIFGVIGVNAGLNLVEVMGFSVLVIAGASQLAALQLISDNAPTIIVILTALAVNLRMAMYSASLVPHLGGAPFWMRALSAYVLFDQPYALSMIEFEKDPARTPIEKMGFFMGVGIPMGISWYAATFVGAVLSDKIPTDIGFEFAVPITFLAVVAPMLKSLAHVATAAASVILAMLFANLPFGSGLLVAALLSLFVGAGVEVWMERRKANR